jgi:hypothetical protein
VADEIIGQDAGTATAEPGGYGPEATAAEDHAPEPGGTLA